MRAPPDPRKAIAAMVRRLDQCMRLLARERDRLDELITDAQELLGCCSDALDLLDNVRDSLSRLV